jgi:regulator of replication initiation timing
MWGRGKKEDEAKAQQAAAQAAQANEEIKATVANLQKQLGDATAEVSKLKRELEEERKAKDVIAKELATAKKEAADAKKEAADAKKAAADAQAGAAKVTAQAAAPAAKPTGMAIGATVVVTGTGADKLRRRDAPGMNSQILDMMLEDGTRLTLLDGPVAADGYNWWYVRQEGNNAMAVVAGEYLKPA